MYASSYPDEFLTSGMHHDSGVPNEIMRVAQRLVPPKDEPGRTILLTSIMPEEGKSLVLRHLAVACGTVLDQRVLIADLHVGDRNNNTNQIVKAGDIKEPMVGAPPHLQDLGDQFSPGLQKSYSIEPTMQPHIKRLELKMSPGNIYRFLDSQLPMYRQEYRLVIVEAPALRGNQQPDTVIFAPLFDQVVVVLQPQRTPADKVQEFLALLRNSGAQNLSVLLNRPNRTNGPQIRSVWINKLLEIPFIQWLGSFVQKKYKKYQTHPSNEPPPRNEMKPAGYLTAGDRAPIQPPPPDRTYPSMELDDLNPDKR